jgi:hypothetical protein
MRTVFTAQSPAEAHLVAGLLDEAGVRCVVQGEMLFGVRGQVGITPASAPRVCVRDEDAERAAAVIAPHARRAAEALRDEDPDARPRPAFGWGAVRIVLLWLLVPAAFAPLGEPALLVSLPLTGMAVWVHLWLHFDRAS